MEKSDLEKPFTLPKLYNRKGNLLKQWHVGFKAFNPDTGQLEEKRIYCPEKFKTEKERNLWAKEQIKKLSILLSKGYHLRSVKSIIPISDKSLNNCLQSVLNLLASTLAPKTVVTYQSSINKLSGFNKTILVNEFNELQVIQFRDHLLSEIKNSPTTCNNTIQNLRVLYNSYMQRSDIKTNPFAVKSLREKASTKNIAFTKEHQILLEKYLMENEPEVYFFTRFVYYSFVRPGELLQLKIRNLNIHENYISVPANIAKSKRTQTAIIIKPLQELINERLNFNESDKLIFGHGLVPGFTKSGINVAFRRHQKALKEIGLEAFNYTLYSWKHTGAVNAYKSGVGIKELQNMLRHSNSNTTDIYLKSLGLRTDPKAKEYNW